MIYLDIAGRCGNQMFQYAFARKLSILNNDEITIDFFLMDVYAKKYNTSSFRDELCNFEAANHYIKVIDGSNKVYQHGSKKQVFVFKVYTRIKRLLKKFSKDKRIANKMLYRIMSHYGIYWYIAPKVLKACKQNNLFVFGYFEEPYYFDDIRDILIKEYTPKQIDANNKALYDRITNSNSVCISFRKWKNKLYSICNQEYYSHAIDYFLKKNPSTLFIIFSDDVEWVKNSFTLPCNCLFESGEDPIYEKVRLMSACKHFIITNSTFAWWVQYLGKSDNKIVVSPNRWYNDKKESNSLVLSSFIIIE